MPGSYGWTMQLNAPACTNVSSLRSTQTRRSVSPVKSAASEVGGNCNRSVCGGLACQVLRWPLRARCARTCQASQYASHWRRLARRIALASVALAQRLPRSECHFTPICHIYSSFVSACFVTRASTPEQTRIRQVAAECFPSSTRESCAGRRALTSRTEQNSTATAQQQQV